MAFSSAETENQKLQYKFSSESRLQERLKFEQIRERLVNSKQVWITLALIKWWGSGSSLGRSAFGWLVVIMAPIPGVVNNYFKSV